jgi:hypothetical protein
MTSRSYHCPILVRLKPRDDEASPRCIARYKIMWEREDTLPDKIKQAWSSGDTIRNFRDITNNL